MGLRSLEIFYYFYFDCTRLNHVNLTSKVDPHTESGKTNNLYLSNLKRNSLPLLCMQTPPPPLAVRPIGKNELLLNNWSALI